MPYTRRFDGQMTHSVIKYRFSDFINAATYKIIDVCMVGCLLDR